MAVDYAVALECDPKRHFGKGDCIEGSVEILQRLKSNSRAAMLREVATESGQDPSEIKVTLHVPDKDGNPIEKEVTLAELESEAKPLDQQASACHGCPGNFSGQPYGCFGAINYPIPESGENWLLGRLQPFGTMGANLCLEFMSEFGVTGEAIRQMRQSGLFEAKKGGKVTFKKGLLKSASVAADQLLETIFMAGNSLNPGHCFGILLWLGAIKVDGKVPTGPEDQQALQTLTNLSTREQKEKHAELELGPAPTCEAEDIFQTLVKALYLSWVHDVPLLMSA